MAQITSVTSEALQRKVRELLPSQRGFGEDLQAQNVIVPIIDLTRSAEGSELPDYLQNAVAFGSQTAFSIGNTTSVIVNNTGFYRIFGMSNAKNTSSATGTTFFSLSDGLSTKTIWQHSAINSTTENVSCIQYDFVVFLASGESLSGASGTLSNLIGSSRQIADVNGVLVDPSGYQPQ